MSNNISLIATRTPYAVTNQTSGTSSFTPVNTASNTTQVSSTSTTPMSSSVTQPQGANVANSQKTGTMSASTTSAYGNNASNSLSNPVGSTTPSISLTDWEVLSMSYNEVKNKSNISEGGAKYAYLSHLGTEANEKIEEVLIYLGYDKSKDGEFIDELKTFKNDYNLYEYSVYDPIVVEKLSEVYSETDEGLVFYVDEEKMINAGFENISKEDMYQLNLMLNKYNITSQDEINHFLAQCYVESWHGNATLEINWEKDVPDEEYFNKKYYLQANIGNTEIGDGYKYRGAGYIQLTGRYNYGMFAKHMEDEKILELGAEYVAENYAWEASAWFWSHNVHRLFENGGKPTVKEVTYIVNSKYSQLDLRQTTYDNIVANEKQ